MRAGGPTFHGINYVKNVGVNICCPLLRLKKSLSRYPMQQELSINVGDTEEWCQWLQCGGVVGSNTAKSFAYIGCLVRLCF